MRTTLILIFLAIISSCDDKDAQVYDQMVYKENKFKNVELRDIYNLQIKRDTKGIIAHLNHSKAVCRETAAMACASIQDTTTIEYLFELLENDKSIKVKTASAFAIGQIGDSAVQNKLIQFFMLEKSELVKATIAEALGKCGNKSGLEFLVQQNNNPNYSVTIKQACLRGVSRFSLRGIFTEEALEECIQIIKNSTDESDIYLASISLTRLRDFDLNKYSDDLMIAFYNTTNIFSKLNIVSAYSKTSNKNSREFLLDLLSSDEDYRIKVNGIRSLSNYQHADVHDAISELLNDSIKNIAIQASEFFIENGSQKKVGFYLEEAIKAKYWRVRTNLFFAALKHSKNKKKVTDLITKQYKQSKNVYEKAELLKALANDIENYKFILEAIKSSNEKVITTYGVEAITEIVKSDKFKEAKEYYQKKNINLKQEFANILKEIIANGDFAQIAIAADLLANEQIDFRENYENSYFLTQALNQCKLPLEAEAYNALQKAIKFIDGKEVELYIPKHTKKTDWESISNIDIAQKIKIKTSKGDITVLLNVNQAPVTVSNFIDLINEGFLNNRQIHRVVPNFVIQDGCPRGDGWGGPNYTICSEFANIYYSEGSIGMASAGKDTESSQWFITHSPTPHLDGRYTNFGLVVDGMDVVHKIEVGDKIEVIEIL